MGLLGSWCSPTVTGAVSASYGYMLHEQQEQKRMFWEDKGGNMIIVPPSISKMRLSVVVHLQCSQRFVLGGVGVMA